MRPCSAITTRASFGTAVSKAFSVGCSDRVARMESLSLSGSIETSTSIATPSDSADRLIAMPVNASVASRLCVRSGSDARPLSSFTRCARSLGLR